MFTSVVATKRTLSSSGAMERGPTQVMAGFDTDKDGRFSREEVKAIVRELMDARDAADTWRASAQNWQRVVAVLVGVLAVWAGTSLAMSVAGIALTKDTFIVDGAMLTSRGGNGSTVVGTRDTRYEVRRAAGLSYGDWRVTRIVSTVAEMEIPLGSLRRLPSIVHTRVVSIHVPSEHKDAAVSERVLRVASMEWSEVDGFERLVVRSSDGAVLSVEEDIAGHIAPASGAAARFCAADATAVVHNFMMVGEVVDTLDEYSAEVDDAGGCDDFFEWLEGRSDDASEPWLAYDAGGTRRRRARRRLQSAAAGAAARGSRRHLQGDSSSTSSSGGWGEQSDSMISGATYGSSGGGNPSTPPSWPG